MIDFSMYMLFSGLEYLAIFFLIFGFFNMNFKYYKVEIAIGVLSTTFVSYILVINSLQNYIALPLILIPLMVLILVRVFKERIAKAIVISICGFAVYGLIQYSISYLLVKTGLLLSSDLVDVFSSLTYRSQVLISTVAISVGVFSKLTNGGFGFMLSKRVAGVKWFIITNIILIIICGLVCISFYVFEILSLLLLGLITILLSVIIIFYMSYRRDTAEYS